MDQGHLTGLSLKGDEKNNSSGLASILLDGGLFTKSAIQKRWNPHPAHQPFGALECAEASVAENVVGLSHGAYKVFSNGHLESDGLGFIHGKRPDGFQHQWNDF